METLDLKRMELSWEEVQLFWILGLILLVAQGYCIWRLLQMKHRDKVYIPFCHLRRDLLAYLDRNGSALSATEFAYLRKMYDSVDGLIEDFERMKQTSFNLHHLNRLYFSTPVEYGDIQAFDALTRSHPGLQAFTARFFACMLRAVLTYTPFFRYSFVWWLTKFLFRTGIFRARRWYARIAWLIKVQEQSRTDWEMGN